MLQHTGRVSSQRGISMVLIVILVLVTIVLAGAALLLYALMNEAETIQTELKARVIVESARLAEVQNKIQGNVVATGFKMDGQEPPVVKAKDALNKHRREIIIERVNDLLEDIKKKIEEGKLPSDAAPKVQDVEKMIKEMPLYDTLQEIIPLIASDLVGKKIDYERRVAMIKTWKSRAAAARKLDPDYRKGRQDQREWLTELLANIRAMIDKENSEFNGSSAKFKTRTTDLEVRISKEKGEQAQWLIKINNELRELKRRLDELKVREVIKHGISISHGKILTPDIPQKIAFINLGSRERIVAGMKFLVAKRGKQGRFEYKGEIEVKKVRMTWAEVSITAIYDTDIPMIDGDLLVNPLFNPRRKVIVVFAGEERTNRLKFTTQNEAKNRIREMGGEIRETVGLDTDFVIFTEGRRNVSRDTYGNYKKAVLLEIPVAEAKEIYRFLGD